MSDRRTVRAEVFERAAGRCEWPSCRNPAEQLCHLTPKGMGGTSRADINEADNLWAGCRNHHMIQEGETTRNRKYEVTELLRAYLALRRNQWTETK